MKPATPVQIGGLLKIVRAMELARRADLQTALRREDGFINALRTLSFDPQAADTDFPLQAAENWAAWREARRRDLNAALARARADRVAAAAVFAEASAKKEVLEKLHARAASRQQAEREARTQEALLHASLLSRRKTGP